MLLLDTCTLLWLAGDPSELSVPARRSIERNTGFLFVSSISALEIGIKARKGRLRLPQPIPEWFPRALALHGLSELPVTGEIAGRSTTLPALHRDPADRILIATAEIHGLRILTPDSLIGQYTEAQTLW